MPRPIEASFEDGRLGLSLDELKRLFHALDTAPVDWTIPPGLLSLAFIDEARCSELHAAFFADDSVTDVMTFPGSPEDDHAGDIAVCPAYASRHAADFGQDFAGELTLYLVHGWLHLAGLDDRSEAESRQMRIAEQTLMSHLRQSELILPARWREDGALPSPDRQSQAN